MFLSTRLQSSMALAVVAVLLSTPTLPLAFCAAERGQVHCEADTPRRAGAEPRCHDSDAPPAAMTCCCDDDAGTLPLMTTARTEVTRALLAIAVSPVEPVIPGGAVRAGIASPVLLTRHRPLFTLFSTFLI
jgi:hypothetical protein